MQPLTPHALFQVTDILFVIFNLFVRHFDPHTDIIHPRKSLGLVCKEWDRLLKTPELTSECRLSPGLNTLKLRDYTVFIDEQDKFDELSLALSYEGITATDLGALLARCEYPEALTLFLKPWTHRREDLGHAIDDVAKQLIYFFKLKNAIDEKSDLLDLFTESYRKSSSRLFFWAGKSNKSTIDLSKTSGLYSALRTFFQNETVIADKRFSYPFFAKLCLIQEAKSEFYKSVFHNAAHEIIKLLFMDGDSAGLLEFITCLDHVTLNNGMPLGAYSLYVPLIFATISESQTFTRFVFNSGYSFDHAIDKLSEYFKETGTEHDQLHMMQLLARRVQDDPTVTVDMICHCPEVAIISKFERVLIRTEFRRNVLNRNIESAMNSATSKVQGNLLFYVYNKLNDLF